ncbi:MAG: bifunctional 2-C-methyl-D-erythritol 4-phosphate cytidylyltransferase/2-C-methyl-D-erythritol 2,4-cyclodiphosphate synthase [Alphaproteobacteria bacterium]
MDNKKPHIAALIVAAGTGERFGGGLPKQYLPLLGRPVLTWSMETFLQHSDISDVRVVIHPDHAVLYKQAAEGLKISAPVTGGKSRQDSVLKGLEALAASKPDYVLIHDAARPGITPDLITGICETLKGAEAVVPGLPVTDTVRRVTGDTAKTENRDGLYTMQTPQGFKFSLILDLHRKHREAPVTDDAALCELAGHKVIIAPGDKANVKMTHADDLALMEQALAARCGDVRTGTGYDVHRLVDPVAGRKLMLCGIEVPHDQVLDGHSDADVALHALTDALLGTICDGDIGTHFSPKDARWKGADSATFLKHAAGLIQAQGGIISHVDVTIICEAPKIGPHRDKMRARMAEILSLPLSRVSLKATTTEGLGFTGRKEGIAAEAVATVRLPFSRKTATVAEDARKWGT